MHLKLITAKCLPAFEVVATSVPRAIGRYTTASTSLRHHMGQNSSETSIRLVRTERQRDVPSSDG